VERGVEGAALALATYDRDLAIGVEFGGSRNFEAVSRGDENGGMPTAREE
jgi:hypothetical protein